MTYPIIFWDSGGTIFRGASECGALTGCPTPALVRAERPHRAKQALAMFGHACPPDLPDWLDALDRDLSLKWRARHSFERLALAVYERLGLPALPEEAQFLADALAGPRYREWLYAGVADTLAALHGAGIRQGLVANTTLTSRMMRNALAGVGLDAFFDVVVCSCDLGIDKPDRRIFLAARETLAHIPASSGRVLYIGNDPEKDVLGARACGWDAALRLDDATGPDAGATLAFSDYRDLTRWVFGKRKSVP